MKKVEDQRSEGSGPLNAEELQKAQGLLEEIGTEKTRGAIIILKVTDRPDGLTQVEGVVKVKDVPRHRIIDLAFDSLQYTKDYMLHRMVENMQEIIEE